MAQETCKNSDKPVKNHSENILDMIELVQTVSPNCPPLIFASYYRQMKDLPKLIASVLGCSLVGILGTPFTIAAIPTWYANLNKPFFAPPNWIFGLVWTLLYLMMGVAFFLIWRQGFAKKKVKAAGQFFLAQLALNFLWSPVFFGLRAPLLGLLVIVAMWVLIVLTIGKFRPLSSLAFYLLLPYLAWVSFATALNAAIVVLN